MTKKTNAHTLVELIIIIVILAAVAFIAIPRLQFATLYRKQADTVARKIVTDLRRTRQLAISNAATDPNGFALNRDGLTYEIVDGSGTPIPNGTFSIDPKITITCPDEKSVQYFQFGPLGNLTGTDSTLTISAEGKDFIISITPATGMIKCTEY
jgi:type II secretory pathway pseudopilin PulG